MNSGLPSFGRWLAIIAAASGTARAWEPGPAAPPGTQGYIVNRQDRSDVVSFWHAIYQASEGYIDRVGWTGNYSSTAAGAEGTVAAVFVDDVERRVNYYRAMVGLDATAEVNNAAVVVIAMGDTYQPAPDTLKSAAAQRSALMISRNLVNGTNIAMSHDPPPACVAWTTAAWNAQKNGDLAQARFGPGAIDAYIAEKIAGVSAWNLQVGHRRYILARDAAVFATGDTPGAWISGTLHVPSNCLYVTHHPGEKVARPADFAAYPWDGYFPEPLNTPFWSLSYPGADFSVATVVVTDALLLPVATTIRSRNAPYADKTLVWSVPDGLGQSPAGADTTYHVTVAGILGIGVPPVKSYTITLIDPWRYHRDLTLAGASSIPASGATFAFVSQAVDGLALEISRPVSAGSYLQGAESNPAPRVIGHVSPGYPLLSNLAGYFRTGAKSFRLTFDKFLNPSVFDSEGSALPDEQSFELADEIVPAAGGAVRFYYRRALMSSQTFLRPEYSVDGGHTWLALGAAIAGNINGAADGAFSGQESRSFPMAAQGVAVKVRFRFAWAKNQTTGYYSRETNPDGAQTTGIFLDDISLTNCQLLEDAGADRPLDRFATRANFAPLGGEPALQPGDVRWLRLQATLGGHAFPAPAKVVTVTGSPLTGFDGWLAYSYPEIVSGFDADPDGDGIATGVEYALGLNPLDASSVLPGQTVQFLSGVPHLCLTLATLRPDIDYIGQWSSNLAVWNDIATPAVIVGGQLRVPLPASPPCFARWKIVRDP